MILAAVDLGNTRLHIGFFRGRRLLRRCAVPSSESGKVNRLLRSADTVAVSSVSPPAERKLRHARLRKMGRDFPPAIAVDVDRPSEVGMDRLANAAAAWARTGKACVAVDLGTAVTFDVVDGRGAFVGGLIAPGPGLGARALSEHTALLPLVAPARPKNVIGRRTVTNIQSGLYWSVAGLIETGLREVRRAMGRRIPAFGTGGDAPLFRRWFDLVVPALTLEGIRESYERHYGRDDGARPGRHRRR